MCAPSLYTHLNGNDGFDKAADKQAMNGRVCESVSRGKVLISWGGGGGEGGFGNPRWRIACRSVGDLIKELSV